eukprot:7841897-Pyramimonas_sp.AAC.1
MKAALLMISAAISCRTTRQEALGRPHRVSLRADMPEGMEQEPKLAMPSRFSQSITAGGVSKPEDLQDEVVGRDKKKFKGGKGDILLPAVKLKL